MTLHAVNNAWDVNYALASNDMANKVHQSVLRHKEYKQMQMKQENKAVDVFLEDEDDTESAENEDDSDEVTITSVKLLDSV